MKKIFESDRLVSLEGNRGPGSKIKMLPGGKAPKRRFDIGNKFEYDKGIWELIYMYRLKEKPNEWIHFLEEIKNNRKFDIIDTILEVAGAGINTPKIVYDLFLNEQDVYIFFSDIPRKGSGAAFTTQQLLKLKKIC